MAYMVRLHDEQGKLIGEVPVATSPGLLRYIKVRFEGECSGGVPSLFGGEKWFARDAGTLDFHAFPDNAIEFVEVKDIRLAPPPAEQRLNPAAELMTPQRMMEKAEELAKEIYALPDHDLRDRLARLRIENAAMHSLVTAHGKKLRPPKV